MWGVCSLLSASKIRGEKRSSLLWDLLAEKGVWSC
jgi:hypothetical protein